MSFPEKPGKLDGRRTAGEPPTFCQRFSEVLVRSTPCRHAGKHSQRYFIFISIHDFLSTKYTKGTKNIFIISNLNFSCFLCFSWTKKHIFRGDLKMEYHPPGRGLSPPLSAGMGRNRHIRNRRRIPIHSDSKLDLRLRHHRHSGPRPSAFSLR